MAEKKYKGAPFGTQTARYGCANIIRVCFRVHYMPVAILILQVRHLRGAPSEQNAGDLHPGTLLQEGHFQRGLQLQKNNFNSYTYTIWLPIYYTHTQNQLLGPGTYSMETGDFTARGIEQRASGPNWEWAHDVARLAAIPHMLYREQWKHKKQLVSYLPSSFPGSTCWAAEPGNEANLTLPALTVLTVGYYV